ncbi:F8A1 family protein [Megaselia abdita]
MEIHVNKMLKDYAVTAGKLKKIETTTFRKFAPNVNEVLSEFKQLALDFVEISLYSHGAMCYLGASKCQKIIGNILAEVDLYIKAAQTFERANEEIEKRYTSSNFKENLEGSLKSYTLALNCLEGGNYSVLRVGVIRAIRKINPHFEGTSDFVSPCHRIFELETSAVERILLEDYQSALQSFADIFDNIFERKKETLYKDLLQRIQIYTILLLSIYNLNPKKTNFVKSYEKYVCDFCDDFPDLLLLKDYGLPKEVNERLTDLVNSWNSKMDIKLSLERLVKVKFLDKVQVFLVRKIIEELL